MLTLPNVTWLDVCLASVGAYLVKQVFTKKNPAQYPPGPPGWPLIGNIGMPYVKPWLVFAEWGKKYGKYLSFYPNIHFYRLYAGDMSHISILGQHIVVLNSVKTSIDMLDKKSSVYSDRPVYHMGGELSGFKDKVPLLPYGDRLRWNRKNFHRIIGSPAAVKAYHPIEEIEAHRFLKRVLANPKGLRGHVRQ